MVRIHDRPAPNCLTWPMFGVSKRQGGTVMNRLRTAQLKELIHRRDKVLAVLHPPTAAHARIMQRAGCETLFVGTGGVVGAYTGLADVGTASLGECLEIAGW